MWRSLLIGGNISSPNLLNLFVEFAVLLNYNKEDKNYDLFELACRVSAKRLFPNFSFLDAPFNKAFYKEGDFRTEVGYMGCRTRVMSDITDLNNQTTGGRGNLSFTSIN